MRVEITLPHDVAVGSDLFGVARQHDPRALERIALDPLVQHQGDPGVREQVFGVNGKTGDQAESGEPSEALATLTSEQ